MADDDNLKYRIKNVLENDGPANISYLVKNFDLSESRLDSVLTQMLNEGTISKNDRGLYLLKNRGS